MSAQPPRLASAGWLQGGALARLLAVLDRQGEEARVVGGAVRNALLNEPVREVDIATTAVPDEVVRRATAAGFKAVPTGIEHGTVTVVVDGTPFEVTTLRRDVETDGRRAKVAFGRDWHADAMRRDFTLNALSASPDGAVHDPVGGLADLQARRVRFIGDPAQRIREDALRILRFFRFHAAYGAGALDVEGLRACVAGRAGLEILSRERVRSELVKLLVAPGAVSVLQAMTEYGLLVPLIGGVPVVARVDAMARVEQTLEMAPDAMRRLAALAVMTNEDALRLADRLRLANAERARLEAMADGPRQPDPQDLRAARVRLYRIGAPHFADWAMLRLARAWAAESAIDVAAWTEFARLADSWTPPTFPVTAADLMRRGFTPGPRLGAALRETEAAWIAADFPTDDASVARLIAAIRT